MSDVSWVSAALAGHGALALPAALIGGVVMGMNPCCLAMFPAAAAACCSSGCATSAPKLSASRGVAFVLGNALAMTVLGVVAALAGRAIGGLSGWLSYLVALVPILGGLHMLGWIRLPMPRPVQVEQRAGILGAFGTGLAMSLVLGPCGTPALAAILAVAAVQGSLAYGALLLFLYGLGNGLPLIVAGTLAGAAGDRIARLAGRAHVERVAGAAMCLLGLWMLWRVR